MERIPEGKLVFLDAEFTSLSKEAELISIALRAGLEALYLELAFDVSKASDWVKENVVPNLRQVWRFSKEDARTRILDWLEATRGGKQVIIVSDCLAYDWVLFCDLLGNQLPDFVYYIPLDLSTMLWMRGIDPDISREEFSGLTGEGKKHRADWDVKVIQSCFEKILEEPQNCVNSGNLAPSAASTTVDNSELAVAAPAASQASPVELLCQKAKERVEKALVSGWDPMRFARPGDAEVTKAVTREAYDIVISWLGAAVAETFAERIEAFSGSNLMRRRLSSREGEQACTFS